MRLIILFVLSIHLAFALPYPQRTLIERNSQTLSRLEKEAQDFANLSDQKKQQWVKSYKSLKSKTDKINWQKGNKQAENWKNRVAALSSVAGKLETAVSTAPKRMPEPPYELRNQNSNLKRAEQNLAKINSLKTAKEKKQYLDEAIKKLGYAETASKNYINRKDKKGFKDWFKRIESVKAGISKVEAAVNEAANKEKAGADAKQAELTAGIEAEKEFLIEINKTYGDSKRGNEFKDAKAIKQITSRIKNDRKAVNALAEKHKDKNANDKDYKNLLMNIKSTKRIIEDMDKFIANQKDLLSRAVMARLKRIKPMAEKAASTNTPMLFERMVIPELNQTQEKVSLLAAFPNDGSMGDFGSEYKKLRSEVMEIAKKAKVSALENNKVPSDSFKGSEREKIMDMVKSAWKSRYPTDKILEYRINGNWERRSEWREAAGDLYKVDYSAVYAYVVTKGSEGMAEFHSVHVTKDHLNGNKLELGDVGKTNHPFINNKVKISNL